MQQTANNGYPVLKWQIKAANTDVEDKATLDALVNELPSGVISPKFNTDKNINTYLSNLIESKEAYANKGIKVSIKNVENRFSDGATYIDEDGTIHYFYINLFDAGLRGHWPAGDNFIACIQIYGTGRCYI